MKGGQLTGHFTINRECHQIHSRLNEIHQFKERIFFFITKLKKKRVY